MPQSVPTTHRLHGKLARDLGLKIVSGGLNQNLPAGSTLPSAGRESHPYGPKAHVRFRPITDTS